MALSTVGLLTPIEFSAEQVTVLSAVAREIFVNEAPLFTRLPHRQVTAQTYKLSRRDPRGATFAVATGGITNSATTLPVADASQFMVGDILEISDATNTERVEVTAAPSLTPSPNTVTIRRAREGTGATPGSVGYAFVATDTIRLIGNSRTGAEIDQQGTRVSSADIELIVQTMQYPVQVGGLAEAIQNIVLPAGMSSVFGHERAVKADEMIRETERQLYYGRGEKPAAVGDRAKMKGIRQIISSYASGNLKTAAGGSYTKASFVADTIQKIYNAGGSPDLVLCSNDFLGYLETWAPNKTAQTGRQTTELGVAIREFVLPLNAEPLTIVPAPMLRSGTAAILSSRDLAVGTIREMFWNPREKRGDAWEGDWIGDYDMHIEHPDWHAWCEGITSAA